MAMEGGEREAAHGCSQKEGPFGREMLSHILYYIYNLFRQCKGTTPSTKMSVEDEDWADTFGKGRPFGQEMWSPIVYHIHLLFR